MRSSKIAAMKWKSKISIPSMSMNSLEHVRRQVTMLNERSRDVYDTTLLQCKAIICSIEDTVLERKIYQIDNYKL